MGDWTPEPWAMYVGQPPWVRSSDGSLIAAAHDGDCEANARRIVACVNACAGLPTEELEQWPFAAPGGGDLLRERDERIRKLEEAARAAYAHVIELQDAWIRGVLSEHDGLGGTRSNRNDDVLHLITHALGEG